MAAKPIPAPWASIPAEPADFYAIQALANGNANDGQQQRAIAFIVNVLCGTYDLSYRPGELAGERDTAFAEGRRFVGLQLVRLMKTKPPETSKPKS